MTSVESTSSSFPPVRRHEYGSVRHTEDRTQVLVDRVIPRLDLRSTLRKLNLPAKQIIRIGHLVPHDRVVLTHLMQAPTASCYRALQWPDAINLQEIASFGRDTLTYEIPLIASVGPQNDKLASIARAVAQHYDPKGQSPFQIVMAGSPLGHAARQIVCSTKTDELHILGQARSQGIVSVRYEPQNDCVFGLRVGASPNQTKMVMFNYGAFRREPHQLLDPNNWTLIQPTLRNVWATALSAPLVTGRNITFIAHTREGNCQVVSLTPHLGRYRAIWEEMFLLPFDIVRPLPGEDDQPGACLCTLHPDPANPKVPPHRVGIITKRDLPRGMELPRSLTDFFA